MFLFPFIEAQSVYSDCDEANLFGKCKIDSGDDTTIPKTEGTTANISDALKVKMAIPAYTCPSSRAGSAKYSLGNVAFLGAKTDYVALVVKSGIVTNGVTNYLTDGWNYYCMYNTQAAVRMQDTFVGPFKIPTLTMNSGGLQNDFNHGRRITSWTYSKDFGWWSDGTSNQLCLGEKHIPSAYREATTGNSATWDGTYANATIYFNCGLMARVVSQDTDLFARSPSETSSASGPAQSDALYGGKRQLGSSHPGIVNFLVGDGSVHSISRTALPRLVTQLTIVNDGNAVSLP